MYKERLIVLCLPGHFDNAVSTAWSWAAPEDTVSAGIMTRGTWDRRQTADTPRGERMQTAGSESQSVGQYNSASSELSRQTRRQRPTETQHEEACGT
jgi:hypothetical protein